MKSKKDDRHFFIRLRLLLKRNIVWLVYLNLLVLAKPLLAQTYYPPPNSRQDINLDANWRFIQSDAGTNAANVGFDDSSWTNLNLPHTWDIPDGQDGPATTYYQGIGWYRSYFTVASTNEGLHFFLKFDGAFLVADIWVNGTYMGEHQGGFSAFVFDVTTNIVVGGATNLIAVKLNNKVDSGITTGVPPLSADFTMWGGIYRDVHLLVTDPVQVSPLDYGSPGVYLMPTNVSASSANLKVTTVLANTGSVATNVMMRTVITDAATNIVTALTNFVTLPAGGSSNVVANTIIANPHLWNGLADPYLYQAYVEVWESSNVVDVVAQPLGFRFFSIDPTNGFSLNGVPYDLHGVSMHQDWYNCGWALSSAQEDTNFMFIKEIGATAVRLPHYQHSDHTFVLGDHSGVILWSEVPNVRLVPTSYSNILQQVDEMIFQAMNHPSIICWGMYNELPGGNGSTNVIGQEVQLAHALDPTRPTTAASNQGVGDVTTMLTDLICFNEYYGWYLTPSNGLAAFVDGAHASYPKRPTGQSEYGAGASIYQHSENPVAWPTANNGYFHPEEWQNIVHEINWPIIKARPNLWTKFVWNLFDFASDTRTEGPTYGRNDKGLVTYDRQTRKDAFYYYKANWTTNPMVYITGHTFTNRLTNLITAKIYANCDTVQLYLNGTSQGIVTSTNCIYQWPITLAYGTTNNVIAVGTKGGIQVTDALVWIAPLSVLSVAAAPGNAQITLNWNSYPGASSYDVDRGTSSGNENTTVAAGITATNYTDSGLTNGDTYFYIVTAYGPGGILTNSAEVSVTPFLFTAGVDYWTNTITSSAQSWNVNSNWSNGTGFPNAVAVSANVTAGIVANQTINLNQPITVGSLSVGSASGAFNISGNGGAITFSNLSVGALLQQVAASSGDTISAPLTNNASLTVENDSGNPLTLSGNVSGNGTITVDGNLNLSGANSFAGTTYLTNGTLQLANTLALQNSTLIDNDATGSVAFNGITSATFGGLSGSQGINLMNVASAPVVLTVGSNNASSTYLGGFSGGGSLIKVDTGTLTLSNANYTGNTSVNDGGTLTVASGSFGSSTGTITVGSDVSGVNSVATLNLTGGKAFANVLNLGVQANETGANADITGSGSAVFSAVNNGSSSNTGGNLTINTTGTVALGAATFDRDAGANTTQNTAGGLIVNSGTVTATSLSAASSVGLRSSDINVNGGSLTIGTTASTGAFKIAAGVGNGALTMTGGTLTYLGMDGLLLGNNATTATATSLASITGASSVAMLTGVTLNAINSATATSKLTLGTGATLYLGGVGLVINQPSAIVYASLGTATVGAITNWTSSAPITLTGAIIFQAADALNVGHGISLGGILSGSGGLTKTGAGALTLSGNNTYAGGTMVSAGTLLANNLVGSATGAGAISVAGASTLGGNGIISGAVTVNSGGGFAPGNPLGVLTVSNNLTLVAGSTTFVRVGHSPLTNNATIVSGILTEGGTLNVTNIGVGAFTAGDSFKLFNAASYSGSFSGFVLPPLNSNLVWNTNLLNISGTLTVAAYLPPAVGSVAITGSNLNISGSGGIPYWTYYILASTNLASAQWTIIVTNQFDANGNFAQAVTNVTSPLQSQAFYRLQLQ